MSDIRKAEDINLYIRYGLFSDEIERIYTDQSSCGDLLRAIAGKIREEAPVIDQLSHQEKELQIYYLTERILQVRESIAFTEEKHLNNLLTGKLPNESLLPYHLMDDDIPKPQRSSGHSAGIDLFLPDDVIIGSMESRTVNFKIAFCFPQGSVGQLVLTTGAAQSRLLILNGLVNCDYRGTIIGILFNLSKLPVHLLKHHRYVKLVLTKVWYPILRLEPEGFDVVT